jgi:hypothetical protein
MDKWRVGDDTRSKETDRCPLTFAVKKIQVPLPSWRDVGDFGGYQATGGT